MKLHVMGPNLFPSDGHAFHVHAEGCADLTRKAAYRSAEHASDRVTAHEFDSLESVVTYVYDNGIMDESGEPWTAYMDEFKVFPCVKDLPDSVPSVEAIAHEWVLIVTGNPVDGFQYIGPVETNTAVFEDLTERVLHGAEWWLAPLVSVADALAE